MTDLDESQPNDGRKAQPSTPYSHRAPSPPEIDIPVPVKRSNGHGAIITLQAQPGSLLVAYNYPEDLRVTVAKEDSREWKYERRWNAQCIMDGLYLGPTKIVRDMQFMQDTQITMVVVVCSEWVKKARLNSVSVVEASLNLQVEYVALESLSQTIHDMQGVLQLLLDHRNRMESLQRKSNILITCETGNDRSAALVAAYLILLYGEPAVKVIQYISLKRFCSAFTEPTKRMLVAWQDITTAKSNVQAQLAETTTTSSEVNVTETSKKRRRDEPYDDDMEIDEQLSGRNGHAPFVDLD